MIIYVKVITNILSVLGTSYNYDCFDEYIRRGDNHFSFCTLCNTYKNKSVTNVRYHIETKHFPGTFVYQCLVCGKKLDSKIRFRDHSRICL